MRQHRHNFLSGALELSNGVEKYGEILEVLILLQQSDLLQFSYVVMREVELLQDLQILQTLETADFVV